MRLAGFFALAVCITGLCGAQAGEMDVGPGGDVHSGGNVTVSGNSTVQGTGKYTVDGGNTVTTDPGVIVTVDDGGTVNVSANGTLAVDGTGTEYRNGGDTNISGTVVVDNDGEYSNGHTATGAGTTTVTSGGTISVGGSGILINDLTSSMTFESGGKLDLATSAEVQNVANMEFKAGSEYVSAGGVTFGNQATIVANSGMTGLGDLLTDVVGDVVSQIRIEGKASEIAGQTITYTAGLGGSSVVINTADSDSAYTAVNVGASNLTIWSTSNYSGAVTATDLTIGNSSRATEATFNGAVTANGNVLITAGASAIFGTGGTLTATGTVTNNSKLIFQSNSSYLASGLITSTSGSYIEYHTNMTGMGAAFANTLLQAGSELHIVGTNTVTDPLALNAGTQAGSNVYIDNGTTFDNTVDVKLANLTVNGSSSTTFNQSVTAAKVIVNAASTTTTTFRNAINADLQVDSKAVMDGATFANHNLVVNASGNLTNDGGSITISAGNTFTNAGIFTNEGTFINSSSAVGAITNTGTMYFKSGTAYTASGVNFLVNQGTIEADAMIGGAELKKLMSDLQLDSGSVFNLMTSNNYTLNATNSPYEIGNGLAGSTVNINAGTYTITFNASTFDVGAATLNIGTGTVALTGNGSVLTTTGNFTAGTGAVLSVDTGTGSSASIDAATVAFSNNSKVNVTENSTLNILNTTSTSFSDTAAVNIAKGGKINVASGTTTFNSGTSIILGENSKFEANDAITFADNTKITVTATGSTISQIHTTSGNITVSANETTEVLFLYTDRDDVLNKIFMQTDNGQVVNYDKLYNALYTFGLDTSGTVPVNGQGIIVTGLRSVLDSMANAVGGYDKLSINKINGGNYTDEVLGTTWGSTNQDLLDYLQIAGGSTLGPAGSYKAYGQLFGEYGAYAATPLQNSADNFRSTMRQRMNSYRSGPACDTCAVVVDPDCGTCGGDVIVTSEYGTVAAGRGNLWGGAIGDWASQKDSKGVHGYDYSAGGVIMGYDYANDCFTAGIAGAYTNGSLKVNRLNTKYDSDMLNIGVYGAYHHESGVFVQGYAGYGYGWNDYDVNMILGGTKHGDYKNQSYSAGMELGYRFDLDGGVRIIPSVGIDYTHIAQHSWDESIHRSGTSPILANHFNRQRYNVVEVPVGVSISKVYDMGDAKIVPEVRGAWIYQANDRRASIGTGYVGSGSSTTMYATDCGANRGMVGGGVKAVFSDFFDVAVDYSLNFKGGYRDHQLTGTANWAF